ncbi:MAG TPA: NrsF family protein [Polyangia bacterium]|nr:NrsF family protein [Polyangia bacterium]
MDDGTDDLRAALEAPAPPPSVALLGAVGTPARVRTRSRFGAFAAVALLGLAWPAYTLAHAALRPDLKLLPPMWVAVGAALWGLSFGLALWTALVPRRGDVLPASAVAGRVAGAAMGLLLVFAAFWTTSVPGVSARPEDLGISTLQSSWGCAKVVLEAAAPVLLIGFFALRRLLPVGARAAGIAVGAAGGAIGGLALHFICPMATAGHVLIGHVGAMIAASVAGALIFGALLDR